MPSMGRHINIVEVNDQTQRKTTEPRKDKIAYEVRMIGDDKSPKQSPLLPYIVTSVCILIILAIIFALVIYIRYRKTTFQKHVIIDYKSSAFKFVNECDQNGVLDVDGSDSAKKNSWFQFGTFKETLHELTNSKQITSNKQRLTNVNKRNRNDVLIKEVQPIISKDESFYVGCSNTLAFSPQSIGSLSAYSHIHRARSKGLLESRRGSRTSLTLSLSPSIDSMSSTRSPSPTRNDVEQDRYILENNSLCLSIEELKQRVADKSETLFQEFWAIPMNHTTRSELNVFGMANKNRYKSILPNDNTRVILPQINDNYLSTYINANYIRDYKGSGHNFIATQGPMPQTVTDFWRLVWHVQASAIVMLTKLTENNKRKCEHYLPNDVTSGQTFGDISVKIEDSTELEGFTERKLILKRREASLTCTHLWFTAWPDHGSPTPQTTHDLLSLVENISQLQEPNSSNNERPVIVHCSAGLGRTGCFIALCNGCTQLQLQSQVDVLGIVSKMRLDRGGMVNNNEQYEFLHRALLQFSQRHHLVDNGVSTKRSRRDPMEDQ